MAITLESCEQYRKAALASGSLQTERAVALGAYRKIIDGLRDTPQDMERLVGLETDPTLKTGCGT